MWYITIIKHWSSHEVNLPVIRDITLVFDMWFKILGKIKFKCTRSKHLIENARTWNDVFAIEDLAWKYILTNKKMQTDMQGMELWKR